ncbi:MAG: hypothetical protein QGG40_03595, partial [Myxococcota bacterium]|nr:hypothetical protein [Myxococcota bacterium]
MWLILWIACGGEVAAPCEDLTCRRAVVVEAWPDRARVIQTIGSATEPLEQVALLQALAEAHPGSTQGLCPDMPQGPAFQRCEEINARPHLWQERAGSAAEPPGAGSVEGPGPQDAERGGHDSRGPEGAMEGRPLLDDPALVSPWSAVEPWTAPCQEGVSGQECQSSAALTAAIEGDSERAAAACRGIEDPTGRDECFFQAGEGAVRVGRKGSLARAIDLCAGAGVYRTRCLTHLTGAVAKYAPGVSAAAESWETVQDSVVEMSEALDGRDSALAVRLESMTWAQ